jgi:hypothetical protein
MPYGASSESLKTYLATASNHWPVDGFKSYPWWFDGSSFPQEDWVRTGKNSGTPHGAAARDKKRGPYKLSFETVEVGPNVGRRIRDEKTGKYYWKRLPLTVTRLVKDSSQGRIATNLTANPLYFAKVKNSYFGMDQTIRAIYKPDPGWYREYTGSFIGSFPHFGPSPVASLAPYAQKDISSYLMSEVSKLADRAQIKLLTNLKNQDVNMAQVIAERRQTVNTVGSAMTRLAKTLLEMKRGQFDKASKTLLPMSKKQLSNDWLAVQYGWKPLLQDIEGAIDYLQSQTFDYIDVVGTVSEDFDATLLNSNQNWCKTKVQSTGKVTVKLMARYKVTFQPQVDASRLGFTNPLALAWELVPYSFVADWFIPIGKWLNTMDAALGLEFVEAHRTTFITETVRAERSFGGVDGDGYTWDTLKTGFTSSKTYCSREILNSSLGGFPLPSFKNPFSGTHVANALALLNQLKKR